MTDLEAEEAQAIREVAGSVENQAKGLVSERNFSQPRRLSAGRLQHLMQTVGANMQDICNQMAAPLRSFYKLNVSSMVEVNVTKLFDDFKAPFVVLALDVGDSIGWLVWEERAATATIEQILAGELDDEAEIEPRELSVSECRVLESLLGQIVVPIANSLGLQANPAGIAQDEESLVTLRDAGPNPDARRLMVHLHFDGPGGPSDMRLYLPNIDEVGDQGAQAAASTVPGHLGTVQLAMSAQLGSTRVPLRDLLALEVGDVIPLGTDQNGQVQLQVEGRTLATGAWGQVGGNIALKIEHITPEALLDD